VSILAFEDTTLRANTWLVQQEAGSLAISGWLETELGAALSRKIRTGRLDANERDAALHRFNNDMLPGLAMLDISRKHFRLAVEITRRQDLGVRSGDALHLAVAANNRLTLVTFDKLLAAGATALGYAVELIA
jgi:predicted nucleic acid-binding protein